MGCNCKKTKFNSSISKVTTKSYSSTNKGVRRTANSGKRIIRRQIK